MKYPYYTEENNCIHRINGHCILTMIVCPSIIRYDDNNVNNMPCDGAGYKEEKGENAL